MIRRSYTWSRAGWINNLSEWLCLERRTSSWSTESWKDAVSGWLPRMQRRSRDLDGPIRFDVAVQAASCMALSLAGVVQGRIVCGVY